MKKLVLSMSLLMSAFAFAQNGLEKIIVEKYYVSNAADAAQADIESTDAGYPTGALPVGSITYRIYADLLPGHKVMTVFADATRSQLLWFKTTTSFYNNPLGTYTPVPTVKKAQLVANPLLALDSYVTLGGAAAGFFGVLKEEDDATAGFFTSSNPAGVLLNENESVMGEPLTSKDGFIAGTAFPVPSFLGFDAAQTDLLSDGSVVGDSIGITDGVYYSTSGARGVDSLSNRVLIAQLTTDGKLSFHLNMVTQFGTDSAQYFVASNPLPGDATRKGDILIPSLNYPDTTVVTGIVPVSKSYDNIAFSVYPNPANEQLTLDVNSTQVNSKGSYTIYGMIGNVILHKDLNTTNGNYKETIDISSLAKGLYTIQLTLNGVTSAKKIIKN